MSESVSKRLRYEVLRRDGHRCRYCGLAAAEVELTVDHVVPRSLGGGNTPDNLVAACMNCNAGKAASNPESELVADVADDALRWAEAQEKAAETMLADLDRRLQIRSAFQGMWSNWTVDGEPVPLPDTWQASIDSFLAAGLPGPVVLDCIQITMAATKIPPENKFRYVCGIAWNRVEKLRKETLDLVSPNSGHVEEPSVLSATIVQQLMEALNLQDDSPEWTEAYSDCVEGAEFLGEKPTEIELGMEAAICIASERTTEVATRTRAMRQLFGALAELVGQEKGQPVWERAREELETYRGGSVDTNDAIEWFADHYLTLLVNEIEAAR